MSLVIKTSRGKVFINDKTGKAELVWNPGFFQRFHKKYSEAQKMVDSEVLSLCEPYIPQQTSMLKKSGELGTKIGSGLVQWIAPYARFQYYGKVMVGVESRSAWAMRGEKKEVINKDLVYHGGGIRGSFWFERAKEANKDSIISHAQRIIDK